MSWFSLALKSLVHYWRSHLGLWFGAFLASAVLTGSLLVGDSVRASLQRAAEMRLGKVKAGVLGGDRWFTEALARTTGSAPIIVATGSASMVTGSARANGVQVLGVDDAFFALTLAAQSPAFASGEVYINDSLARRLDLKVGDPFITRLEKPSAISRDAPLSGDADEDIALRRRVAGILDGENGGAFQLTASQVAMPTVFIALSDLQAQLEMEGRVNVALHGEHAGLQARMNEARALEDFGLSLVQDEKTGDTILNTDRVFLDDVIAKKLAEHLDGYRPVLTYLVNGILSAKGGTPYSMVAAAEGFGEGMAITQWLAEDQKLQVGDEVEMKYFTMGLGRELKDSSAKVKVSAILPMDDPRVTETWTPEFPGVSEAANCRDWKPGIPMETAKIRDTDEQYWDDYRTTPKAFIPLALGQQLWSNRFGKITSIRFKQDDPTQIEDRIVSHLDLADVGLTVRDLGGESSAAARGSVDFGGLFAGLSMFLIAAALVFAALLFLFTLERRAGQVGVLTAVGWPQSMVKRMMLSEAGLIGLLGALAGILGGVVYTQLALAGLNGAWGGATAGMRLSYAAQPQTLLISFLASSLVMWTTLWWVSRRMFRTPPRELIAGGIGSATAHSGQRGRWRWVACGGLLLALALSIVAPSAKMPEAVAGLFFGAGFGLLVAALAGASGWMQRLDRSQAAASSLMQVGIRNVVRRPGRSLAAMGMMAGGIFLVVSVNAFRMSAEVETSRRDNGTGGFALVGESSLPVYEDLNGSAGREVFGLEEEEMKGVRVIPFRVREGDDASCLNLNAAQSPQLAGVNALALSDLGAFSFTQGSWDSLLTEDGSIPAIADMNTAMWGLKKGVGDTVGYTDAKGNVFQVRLVGLLAGSILQGKIIIDERAFLARYPDAAGYRYFLIDAPADRIGEVSEIMTSQLEQRGLALESTKARLQAFQAVQNTYIGIFTVLGGLGVLLGTVGLGVLVARHVLERRGELALMQAVGFQRGALRRMVLGEHIALLITGLLIGFGSALLAVWPSLRTGSSELPLGFLALLLIAIMLTGVVACAVAVVGALRGNLLEAIRRE
jgi:putative ABC transport system permease protein